MKATKIVIGAGMLIALVAASGTAAADDYLSAFNACPPVDANTDKIECFVNADDATTGGDPRACTVGTTVWRVQHGDELEPVECALGS